MRTYKKTHTNKEALENHIIKIKKRDGKYSVKGKEITYSFPKTTRLLAPNGKKSNLNEIQYKIVRSKAFKKWFGDWEKQPEKSSKILDKNGEPLVVRHGSQYYFHEFKASDFEYEKDWKYYPTFWFTIDNELAKYHTQGQGKVYEAFLNVRNPKIGDSNLYKKEKFDGYIAIHDKKGIFNAVAISSNQIKLADGTNTRFNKRNPNISL